MRVCQQERDDTIRRRGERNEGIQLHVMAVGCMSWHKAFGVGDTIVHEEAHKPKC